MHRSILFFLLLAIGITPINGYGQITFEAKLSKTKLGLNERLRLSFQMNQNGDNFLPPSFDGFKVVGGPNQSVSNSWVNGVRLFMVRAELAAHLRPRCASHLRSRASTTPPAP